MLQAKDYEKMLQFIMSIPPNNGSFCKTLLDQLKEHYGHNYMTLFAVDNNGKLYNPVARNISNYNLDLYMQYFYKVDMFHTMNIPKKLYSSQNVVSVTDMMSYEQFYNTEYYNDFFKKMNLHYEIAMPLIYDEKILGVLGIYRTKEEGDFEQKDYLFFNNINKFIAFNFNTSLYIEDLQNEQLLYKNCAYNASLGIIVIGQNLSLMYYNEEAKNICMDIMNGNSVQNSMSLFTNFIYDKIMSQTFNHIILHNICQIKIIPQIIPRSNGTMETVYIVYLRNNEKPIDKILDRMVNTYSFSKREKEIVEQVYYGLSNEEIAQKLYLSINTVKTHIENVYKKMGINKRVSLLDIINEISYTI